MTIRTAEFGLPSPEGPESADGPTQIKALADAVEAAMKVLDPKYLRAGTSGQLIVVSGTGAPAYVAMRGDATIIADGSVSIGDDKVVQRHIGPQAVGAPEIANDGVQARHIATGAVGADEIATDAVDSSEIAAGAVGNAELATDAVTQTKMADNSVGAAELIADSVGTSEIAALAVLEGELADKAVTSRKAGLTAGRVAATGDLTMDNTFRDVPGASLSITPAVASTLFVVATFDFTGILVASFSVGSIRVDSAAEQTNSANFQVNIESIGGCRATVGQVYALPLTAAAHTVRLRAKASIGSGNTCYAVHTGFIYLLVAS